MNEVWNETLTIQQFRYNVHARGRAGLVIVILKRIYMGSEYRDAEVKLKILIS